MNARPIRTQFIKYFIAPFSSLYDKLLKEQKLYVIFWWGGMLHPGHMEVPRLGVSLELQPPAYTTATATLDP